MAHNHTLLHASHEVMEERGKRENFGATTKLGLSKSKFSMEMRSSFGGDLRATFRCVFLFGEKGLTLGIQVMKLLEIEWYKVW